MHLEVVDIMNNATSLYSIQMLYGSSATALASILFHVIVLARDVYPDVDNPR